MYVYIYIYIYIYTYIYRCLNKFFLKLVSAYITGSTYIQHCSKSSQKPQRE